MRLSIIGLTTFITVLAAAQVTARAQQAAAKPNILVIMGDDIGYWNLSTYNQGMMGYRTPNIDSIPNNNGRCCSRFNAPMDWRCGRSRRLLCGFQCYSICEWIPSSGPKNPRTILVGAWTIRGRSCRHRRSWRSSFRVSGNSRRAPNGAASASITHCRRCRSH